MIPLILVGASYSKTNNSFIKPVAAGYPLIIAASLGFA